MIRALQKRFVLAAMISLFVLLLILIGGITGASYFSMERTTDMTLEMLCADTPPPMPPANDRRPMFGYQIGRDPSPFMNHFTVFVREDHSIAAVDTGFAAAVEEAQISDYVQKAIAAGKPKGKAGAYKYLVTPREGGGSKIVFLDASAQARMLGDTFRAACVISLVCMGLMFVILLMVSRRTVRPIAENMEKQRRFVTDAGHEIKTPLAIIQANTDAMELHLGESKWSGRIREQTLRLDGLMRQLLSLSKTEEGVAQQLEEVDLSGVVERCAAAFADLDSSKGIHTEITPRILLRGNKESLEQLVSILLDNAVKYSQDGGVISVKLERMGKKAVLEVRNACDALPEAAPGTLFDRFYRADAARTQKNGGYGIGLSIARAIAEQHRGKIAAFYDDAQTIRFRVEL